VEIYKDERSSFDADIPLFISSTSNLQTICFRRRLPQVIMVIVSISSVAALLACVASAAPSPRPESAIPLAASDIVDSGKRYYLGLRQAKCTDHIVSPPGQGCEDTRYISNAGLRATLDVGNMELMRFFVELASLKFVTMIDASEAVSS
jgi:hypothetical protein